MIKKIHIKEYDSELWKILQKEMNRQEEHIELIASENYVSSLVMEAQGSILTNKYAEGYPQNRFYNGCEFVDDIEQLAIDRAKTLFGADYANVQPHSGSQANFSVYQSLLKIGDTVLSMKLSHGGHITHGASSNFSGKLYNFIFYGINKYGEIDYESMQKLAEIHRPKMIVGGFSSYSGDIDWKKMREIAESIDAYFFVDMAHVAGLVAAKLYPNPIDYAHVVTTTTHKTLSGPRGGMILAKGGRKSFYRKLNRSVFPGTQGGPLMHVIAAKAISFKEAMESSFRDYQRKIVDNAKIMSSIFITRGFDVVSGITKNHLFLVNLSNRNLTGDKASEILNRANIIVNKNSIPNDVNDSSVTTGIRIGTPAITKRKISNIDVSILSNWICDILDNIGNTQVIECIKEKVKNICKKYPVYMKKKS